MRPTVWMYIVKAMLFGVFFNKLVRTEASLAALAVHKRIVEVDNMSAGYPYLGIHKNSRVKADVVFVLLHEFTPPCFFYIIFHLYAKGAVVPCVCKSAIKLGACKNKAAVFAKRNYLIHAVSAHKVKPPKIDNEISDSKYDSIGLSFVKCC